IPRTLRSIIFPYTTLFRAYTSSFDETVDILVNLTESKEKSALKEILDSIRLYKIEKPFVANSSNYGVPLNRERVLFIGCRKDQRSEEHTSELQSRENLVCR